MIASHPRDFHLIPESFVETRDEFAHFVECVLSESDLSVCSIDTEADSMHSYATKLCLIQFSTPERLAIIDPLAIGPEGLSEFPAFIDRFEEVWMHGADYDISMFSMTFGWVPKRILDTQIAARLLGATKFGLANLLEEEYDVKLSKQSQKADWSRRPLPDRMLEYAFNDVRYLIDLGTRLTERLRERNREEWFLQSCEAARDNVLDRDTRSDDEVWRISGWGKLSSKGLNYLKALWFWRDGECEKLDRPAFKFVGNKDLLAMAIDLEEGKGLNPPRYLRPPFVRRLRDAVRAAELIPKDDYPSKRIKGKGPRLDIDETRFEEIRAIRNRRASELGIEPTVVATRGVMERLASTNLKEEEMSEGLLPWQSALLLD